MTTMNLPRQGTDAANVLHIATWIGIRQGCPIECEVLDNDDTVLSLGDGGLPSIQIVFDIATLRELVQISTEALTKLGVDIAPEGEVNGKG